MYKQFGGSAFLFVILSALISNVGGTAPSKGSNKNSAGGTAASKPPETKSIDAIDVDARRCAVVEILRRHFGQSEQPPAELIQADAATDIVCQKPAFDSIEFDDADKGKTGLGMVLLATVPNPLQTANALEFDRNIEALQEAASTSGYDFESIVTEWELSNLAEPKDAKDARSAGHYRRLFGDEPGAMLFHRRLGAKSQDKDDFLLLILVPESPTYGLNMHAAKEALTAIGELTKLGFATGPANNSGKITWIGPNYSASTYGLERLSLSLKLSFDAFSGSITSRTALDSLERVDGKLSGNKCSLGDNDVSALEPDECALPAIQQSGVLGDSNNIQIAILQEDESAYGAATVDDRQLTVFHFPRGISHVRGVFGSQLVNFKPNGESSKAQDSKAAFDLADAMQQPFDTAPEFAAQSPYSNEGVLDTIASGMMNRQIGAIIILATDPLDQLFLARYYHQKLPDARLVLFDAERLLTDLRYQYDLDGTITISRFPLFEDAYLETPVTTRHALTFMNSTQEGIFFAALHQIDPHPIWEGHPSSSNSLWEAPVWVSVASHGSFWPVRRIGGLEPAKTTNTLANSYVVTEIPPENLPRIWVIVDWLVSLCAIVHLTLFLVARPLNNQFSNSPHPWAKALALHRVLTFYLQSDSQGVQSQTTGREYGRRYWLFSATMQLVLVLSYVLLPAAFFDLSQLLRLPGLFATFLYLANFLLLFFLALDLARLCAAPSEPFPSKHARTALFLLFISVIWMVATLIVLGTRLGNPYAGKAFAIRCVHLASGVSPVMPLLLASLGFIVASIVNLNALALARDRNPQMPKIRMDILRLRSCEEQLASYIECWGILPNPQGLVLSFFVVATCVLVNPFQIFASVDGRNMTWIFAINVIFGLWTIGWLWTRFLMIWDLLRFVLEALEGSTLRFAFSRLPKIFSLAPIWSYSGLRRTLVLPMRWFEYFRVTPKQASYSKHLSKEADWLNSVAGCLFDNQVLIEGDYVDFNEDQNRYAAEVATSMPEVRASWMRGGPDAQNGEGMAKDDASTVLEYDGIKSRIEVPSPCGTVLEDACEVAIANEFIAMRFGAYIRYVMLQLKNLMSFMSIGLLLFLLATVSYPFRQPERIAWSLLVIVVILLFGVGKVLMQMDRDSILSRMSETPAGKVDRGAFIWHMLSVGGLPVITALSAIFPAIGNFLFSWIQPLISTLH